MRLTINGKSHEVDVDPTTPLLWVIREQVGLTGTKYGCGVAQCGACTVHVNGLPVRSCQLPVSAAGGARITTIEGLASGKTLHKVQKAWIDNDVPQCGTSLSIHAFCTLCRVLPEARPSIVVILAPPAALTGSWQERTGRPFTCTVQAPHCATPQPYLVPVRPTCSRITQSRGVVGSTSTS